MEQLPPPGDQSLGDALLESAWTIETINVVKDLGEVALDSALDEGTLQELPIIGWAFGGVRVVRQLRDRLFLKKLACFLTPISRVTPEARREFMGRIGTDPKLKRRVGDGLVLLIDRHEHFEKSEVLGLVFAAFVSGRIGYGLFQKAATVVDRASTQDFEHLSCQAQGKVEMTEDIGHALTSIGAATSKYAIVDKLSDNRLFAQFDRYVAVEYELNDAGSLIASVLQDWKGRP